MFNRERPYKDLSDEGLKFNLGFTKRRLQNDREFRKTLKDPFLLDKDLEEFTRALIDFDAELPVLRKKYKELRRELRRRS
jgi:hypothetical protein